VRARYAVTFARSARKELEALDPPLVARILARIETLADKPRPPGCRKLRRAKNL
jgi:mRNA interferase RelE/StbE